jgi:hypothetical protein
VGPQRLGIDIGLGPIHPQVRRGGLADAGQDRLFGLRPKALQRTDALPFAGGAKLVERGDLQLAE